MFNLKQAIDSNPNGIIYGSAYGLQFHCKQGNKYYQAVQKYPSSVFKSDGKRAGDTGIASFVTALPNTYSYMVAEKGGKPQFWAMCQQAVDNTVKPVPVKSASEIQKGLQQDFNAECKKKVEELVATKKFQSDLNEMVSRKYGSFVSEPDDDGLFWIRVTKTSGDIIFDLVQFSDKSVKPIKWNLVGEAGSDNHKLLMNLGKVSKIKSVSVPAIQGSDIAVANAVKLGKPAGLMTFLNASLKAAGKPTVSMGSLTTLGAEADTASFWENHKNKFYIGGGIAMIAAVVGYGYMTFKERK
jgi:hypothetical protein